MTSARGARRRGRDDGGVEGDGGPPGGAPDGDPAAGAELDETAVVRLPIGDELDLHSFPPREVPDLVRHWLDEAYAAGHRRLRIVHGRGAGVQRRTVAALLERDPRVIAFGDADRFAGGWGATWVTLR